MERWRRYFLARKAKNVAIAEATERLYQTARRKKARKLSKSPGWQTIITTANKDNDKLFDSETISACGLVKARCYALFNQACRSQTA